MAGYSTASVVAKLSSPKTQAAIKKRLGARSGTGKLVPGRGPGGINPNSPMPRKPVAKKRKPVMPMNGSAGVSAKFGPSPTKVKSMAGTLAQRGAARAQAGVASKKARKASMMNFGR